MIKKGIRKGFTLIELLVVVAIIGILAALVVVSVTGARGRANDATIKNAVSNVENAAQLHRAVNTTALTNTLAKALADADVVQFKDDAGNSTMTKAPIYPGKTANDTTDGYVWTVTAGAEEVRGKLTTGADSGKWYCGKDGSTFVGTTTGC